jgi:plasmid stability protein
VRRDLSGCKANGYLLTRNIDPRLKRRLRKRARFHGRSMSEEARILLGTALLGPPERRGMGTALAELLPQKYRSADYVFEIRGKVSKPPDFD